MRTAISPSVAIGSRWSAGAHLRRKALEVAALLALASREMSFLEHLEELRRRLIWSLVFVGAAFAVSPRQCWRSTSSASASPGCSAAGGSRPPEGIDYNPLLVTNARRLTMRTAVLLLCLSLVVLAPPSTSAQSTDVRAAIDAVNAKFGAAWAKKDAAAVTALYTANATLLPPNVPRVTGTEAILEFWKAGLAAAPPAAKLTSTEVEAHGDTAHEVGTYQMFGSDGKVVETGKYIVVWKREGGQWKLHRDMWNADMPAAAM